MSNWDLLNLEMTSNNQTRNFSESSAVIVQKFEDHQLQDVRGFKTIEDARKQYNKWTEEMSRSMMLWLFYCKTSNDDESEDDSDLYEQDKLTKSNTWMTGVPANNLTSKMLKPLAQVCGDYLVYLDKPNVITSTEYMTLKELSLGSWLSKNQGRQVYFSSQIAEKIEFSKLLIEKASFYAQDGHRFTRESRDIARLCQLLASFYNNVVCSDKPATSQDLLDLYSRMTKDEKDGFYCSFMNIEIK